MAIKVKGAAESAQKFAENAGRAGSEYQLQAIASAEQWAANTAASESTFREAISAPGVSIRFRSGVVKAGAAKFARKIKDVGGSRYGPGVSAGKPDYQANVEPYLQTIGGLTLSTRKPRGDISNYTRSQEVGKALNAKRLALMGVGA